MTIDVEARELDGQAGPPPARLDGDTRTKQLPQLTDEQRRVLDCLHAAADGLTFRQLQSKTGFTSPVVEEALQILVTSCLVVRLNTLIPSYAHRYPGIRLYDE